MTTPLEAATAAIFAADAEDLDKHKAKGLLYGYHAANEPFYAECKILAVETEFSFPVLNPETKAASKTFDHAGMLDLIVEHRGRTKIVEHKTASDSLDPDSDYWDRLEMDTQVSLYYIAAEAMGQRADSVVYDVIRKPGIAPKQIPELDEDENKIVVDAGGARVYLANGKPRQSGDAEKGYVLKSRTETPEEFGKRLCEDTLARPFFYFARREIARLDSQTLEAMQDNWQVTQQILAWRRAGLWPRNPDVCANMGGCEFFSICAGRAHVDGVNFLDNQPRHAELSEAVQNGSHELLTQSRIRALRKCPRFHQLRYEQGVRPAEESAALHFGRLFHSALEAYFNQMKINQECGF